MEDVVTGSGLDWTVVRPPRLTDRPSRRGYRTAYGRNVRGGIVVARAEVADLMLRVVDQPEAIGQVIGIADRPGSPPRADDGRRRRPGA